MKNICFFSVGHNGDIIHSKAFVYDVIKQLDIPCFYHHEKSFKTTKDLPEIKKYPYEFPSYIDHYYDKFAETEDTLFINIWLHPWRISNDPEFFNINLKTFYKVFSIIYQKINDVFGTNIKLKGIDEYLPFINFSLIEKKNIESYVMRSKNRKILLCNGPCLAGQSLYNGDMSNVIKTLSLEYKNIDFIATQKFYTDDLYVYPGPRKQNVYFTDDIIQLGECDLNEIGYLSMFCDLIVGRNSGPFCYSTIRENYKNKNKIFYAFGKKLDEKLFCFHSETEIDAKFIYNDAMDEKMIYDTIRSIINTNLIN